MSLDQAVRVVQATYPQIYLACHTRHQRKRSTEHALSPRDASILAHLDERTALTAARLASHLGIARSTLSEALKRLTTLGFVRDGNASAGNARVGNARAGKPAARTMAVLLTSKGARAIQDTSVLETKRLRQALEEVSGADLRTIVAGLQCLAAACRRIGEPARYVALPEDG